MGMGLDKIIIRPAQPKDAPAAARLMYYSGPNYMLAFFSQTEDKAIAVLRKMFPLPRHAESYTYAFVAQDEGNVVGAFSGFNGKSLRCANRVSRMYGPVWLVALPPWQIPRMIAAFNDFNTAVPPVLDEEYYVMHFAVLPDRQGQGIGKQLMEFAEGQARTKGLKRLTLDVELDNEGARRFYKRSGFQAIKVVTDLAYCKRFGFRGSIRMVKPV